ncbi:BTAD domain-containing putative transcriptional regulator [Nocardioides sp. CER19]|uniref:AfsR/SARP family transcriptional regulator n=1 Tax=Nocardioides sp. CER19 TaxID=3038538 RepID=UPI00244840DD|nr:BTAD domain-containing putative transcriptional regulator [Nocardioides sp. CER19]MDH2413919.1 BTAD domain-containing putative transcriptional regulator [Nocardioides sp. CER19]
MSRGQRTIELGGREQRLTALLALRGRRPRVLIAATLWPDTMEDRARASLRTAIKRTQHEAPGILVADRSTVGLSSDVHVDVAELVDAIQAPPARQRTAAVLPQLLDSEDLLPGWYDDWVLYERERLAQKRLRALETLAGACYQVGDLDTALRAAQEAVRIEPLLDAMRSIVIKARLGLGDVAGAIHEFQLYRRFLHDELGIEPTAELFALFNGTRIDRWARDGAFRPRPRQGGAAIADVAGGIRSVRPSALL